ncbi:MAG: hypothetical protein CMB98_03845 [Flavobacteriaceae bacterium]|nr:hypothetical protein [Flavobacteriaceae bacterium]|tara:strand:+ start:128 stop:343 length:216 start_codon:yes stop_codon:yes gene_type:complete
MSANFGQGRKNPISCRKLKKNSVPSRIEDFIDIIYTGIQKKSIFHKKTLSQWRARKVSGCFLYFYINKKNG